MIMLVGRFAPSPTGPLHLGSLVAAAGSWLFARSARGKWLVRMEDLDTPRVVEGSADEILYALERYGLTWDGEVLYQSQRTALYDDALRTLRARNLVFECGCSRADLRRAASAPLGREPVYPGTCRDGLPPGRVARAVRFRAPDEVIAFNDLVAGHIEENVAFETGDFVIRRADGVYAYQLAVVVDDAAQGVTQVVRGADLLSSTPRQIALQRALGLLPRSTRTFPWSPTPKARSSANGTARCRSRSSMRSASPKRWRTRCESLASTTLRTTRPYACSPTRWLDSIRAVSDHNFSNSFVMSC